MTTQILMEALPIKKDADGELRVGETRLTLDTVVSAFSEGGIVEEIAQQYPSVQLADVYSVIGFYLRQTTGVRTYLEERQKKSVEIRRKNESRLDPIGIRYRLVARNTS